MPHIGPLLSFGDPQTETIATLPLEGLAPPLRPLQHPYMAIKPYATTLQVPWRASGVSYAALSPHFAPRLRNFTFEFGISW